MILFFLYYQKMRASNEFVSGNWSEAYEIPLSSMGTSSASTSSTSAGKKQFKPW